MHRELENVLFGQRQRGLRAAKPRRDPLGMELSRIPVRPFLDLSSTGVVHDIKRSDDWFGIFGWQQLARTVIEHTQGCDEFVRIGLRHLTELAVNEDNVFPQVSAVIT